MARITPPYALALQTDSMKLTLNLLYNSPLSNGAVYIGHH